MFKKRDETPEGIEDELKNPGQEIRADDIEIAVRMLKTYLDPDSIEPLLVALETLKTDTDNEDHQRQVVKAFNALSNMQGAILTYAPYLNVFVSDDPFAD